ncbi:MAG TPA: hypothetical protein VN616_17495 [Puia sp.]|nr:hypothetical protein [Puia sp.]
MNHHSIFIRYASVICVLAVASIACNKTAPESAQRNVAATKGQLKTDSVTTESRKRCKIGSPLESCGEFVFLIDSTDAVITGVLGDRGGGFWNYGEFVVAPDGVFPLFNVCNFSAYIYHLRYHLTMKIYDLRGRLIFAVNDNKWQVYRNAAGKFNYDDKGFEVYDKENRIAFNLNLVDFGQQFMYFQGIIPCSSSSLAYYNRTYTFFTVPYGTPALNAAFDHLYDSIPIQPLFRYTGRDWQHSRL